MIKCSKCKFWFQENDENGHCHLYPPSNINIFIKTSKDDFCGQGESKGGILNG